MGLAYVFAQKDTVENSQQRVHTIHSQQQYIRHIACLKDKFADRQQKDKSHSDTSNVSGKTDGLAFGTEIEERKDEAGDGDNDKIRHLNEAERLIDDNQGNEDRHGVTGSDAIDAVHEIIRVDDADKQNKHQ